MGRKQARSIPNTHEVFQFGKLARNCSGQQSSETHCLCVLLYAVNSSKHIPFCRSRKLHGNPSKTLGPFSIFKKKQTIILLQLTELKDLSLSPSFPPSLPPLYFIRIAIVSVIANFASFYKYFRYCWSVSNSC